MSSNNWPIPQTPGETLRQVDRRLQQEETRPMPRTAADFLGPGFGPHAILTGDWSDEACMFNGFFYSDIGALNSPNAAMAWIGQVFAAPGPSGIQRVQTFRAPDWPPVARMRKFETVVDGSAPVFTGWIAA